MTNEMDENIKLFQSIGLSEQKAKETLKNVQVTKNLKTVIAEVRISITSASNLPSKEQLLSRVVYSRTFYANYKEIQSIW